MEQDQGIRIGIVGARSVLGRAVAEALHTQKIPIAHMRLFGERHGEGLVVGGRKYRVQELRDLADNFHGLTYVIFCTSPIVVREHARYARQSGITVIDCSGEFAKNRIDGHTPTESEIDSGRLTHNGILVPRRLGIDEEYNWSADVSYNFAADTAHDVARMLSCESGHRAAA